MDAEYIALIMASVAGLVSIVSFFKSNSKDQLETDGVQNDKISKVSTKQEVLESKISDLSSRVSMSEGRIDGMNQKIGQELKEVENKIETRIATMETNLTRLITAAIQNQNNH